MTPLTRFELIPFIYYNNFFFSLMLYFVLYFNIEQLKGQKNYLDLIDSKKDLLIQIFHFLDYLLEILLSINITLCFN